MSSETYFLRRHYLSHRQSGLIRFERALRVRPSYFPNSSIKGEGASVFLSGRDHPYYLDFHTPTKFLSETVQSPGRSGMPTTWGNRLERHHQPRDQCHRHPQMDAALSKPARSSFTGFVPAKSRT